jgi:hypothetical protein
MTVARARSFPKRGTILYNQTGDTVKRLCSLHPDVKIQLETALSTPMLSGFLLAALLSAPYEVSEVRRIKKMLMWKEVSVMESIPRKPTVDWIHLYTMFDPLSVDYRSDGKFNNILRRCLYRWTLRCSSTVLYPSMGNRAISAASKRRLEYYLCHDIDSGVDVTSTSLEHYYSRTGVRIDGECEMKQKWYPTQASPRTYFAQGGTAYHSSKFLRDVFNWLCDSYRPTNRHDRVSPSGMTVDQSGEDVYIYDLTSFSSLFHEHRSFLYFLSVVTSEVVVRIFDSWEGPLSTTLGGLIRQYLEINVSQPSYSTKIPQLSDLELVHSVAGFLGVFGNLASCTFPHGIALGTVRGTESDSWCAGDDAGSIDEIESDGWLVNNVATSLGSISREKTFRASEEGAVALKRPICLTSGVLYQRRNILWPILSVMCDNDSRYKLVDDKRPVERVTGGIVSFLRTCELCPMSASDIEFAYSFFVVFYEKFGLPLSGWYPPLTGYHPWKTSIPRMDRSVFGQNPLIVLVKTFFGTQYVGARVDDLPWDGPTTLHTGNSFECNSDRHLSYLVKLGFLKRDLQQCLYEGRVGFNRAIIDATQRQHKHYVYTFTVLEAIPSCLMPLT